MYVLSSGFHLRDVFFKPYFCSMTGSKFNAYKYITSTVLLSLFLMLFPKSAISQEWFKKAESLAAQENFEQAIKTLAPYANTLPQDTLLVRVYKTLGTWHGALGNLLKSTGYYEKSLALENKLPYKRPSYIAYLYNNLAYNYDLLYQGDQVVEFYKKAHHLWYEKDYNNFSDNITAFGNLIPALLDIGLLKEAEFYFSRLLQYADELRQGKLKAGLDTMAKRDKMKCLLYIQLTMVRYYTGISNREGLRKALAEFDSLLKQDYHPEDLAMYLEALDNAGYSERFREDYNMALYWYKKADKLAHNDFYRMKGAANQAVTYYYAGNHSVAFSFAQKALSFLPPEATTLSAFGLRAMCAELLVKQQKLNPGIEELETIFTKQLKRTVLEKDFINLTIDDISAYMAPQQISILLFAGKAYLEKYKHEQTIKDVQIAHHFFGLAAALFSRYYALEGYSDLMDYFRKEINGRLLETGGLLGLSRQKMIELFNRLENNTSQRTWKKYLKAHSMQLGIPGEWLGLKNQLMGEKNAGTRAGLQESNDRVNRANMSLDSLERLIHAKSPKFLAYDTANASVTDLLEKMGKGQGFLRYFMTVREYYGILVTHDTVIIKKIGEIQKLDSLVKYWVSSVRNPTVNVQSVSVALWKDLLEPFYVGFAKMQSLMIIPEGALSLLAFEPLVIYSPKPLFNKDLSISYGYDVKMLQLQHNYKNQRSSLIAFAPMYKDRMPSGEMVKRGSDFYALPGAQKEAEEVADLLKGEFLLGRNANRQRFLEAVGKYGVYHLAMHAEMDTLNYERSNLVFSGEEKMYFNELYANPLDAELIVLSACNTGAGFFNPGEGVMSLSRALAYSGVQSSVYALWELPDAETSWIIKAFYQGLKAGLPKHEALAAAKTQFRETFPEKAHPFFWAGLVINGNNDPITFPRKNQYWILAIIPLLVIGFWYSAKNKNRWFKGKV